MALNNPWVGYITRNYLQIKTDLLSRLGTSVPELSDHSQSNIMVVILDIFAGITEMLNYYIDNMAREAFISTARKYSSMVRLTRLIDYRIKASISAKVDVSVSFLDVVGDPLPVSAFTLPKGTAFTSNSGIQFISIDAVPVLLNATSMVVPCTQELIIVNQLLGISTSTINQIYSLGDNYTNETIDLTVGGVVWTLKSTLGRSEPEDKHFVVDISADKIAYIKFGDDINGAIPQPGLDIIGNYSTTSGILGNVGINTINSSSYDFTLHGIIDKNITNILGAVAGSNYEDIEKIRRSAPLSIRTLDRAVTKQDYIDITKLAPGVEKANLKHTCGKAIEIYIVPNGGGIASQSLLNTTKDFVDLRKMVTTFISVLPTGQSDIYIDMNVKAKFRASLTQTDVDIRAALTNLYSYANSDVNKPIRTSDLIALVDNLSRVDYITLNKFYLIPYIRPTLSTTPELIKEMSINVGSTDVLNWELKYDGINFVLLKNGLQVATIPVNTFYTDPLNILTLKIIPNSYVGGMVWEFKTYPFNGNIELDNFSIPIISNPNIILNITETLTI